MSQDVQFDESDLKSSGIVAPENSRDIFAWLQLKGVAHTRQEAFLFVLVSTVAAVIFLTGGLVMFLSGNVPRPANEPAIPIEMYAEEESRAH